jgi:hypothetical protein
VDKTEKNEEHLEIQLIHRFIRQGSENKEPVNLVTLLCILAYSYLHLILQIKLDSINRSSASPSDYFTFV